ncbi:MAG: hypothetical protein JXR64_05135 [Spirochaetales bacterium]|nr:hypothetical protein [Spirochaetales bacterium]
MISKTLVVYYSKNGSSKYLAQRLGRELLCDVEPLVPRINSFFTVLLGLTLGLKKIRVNVEDYNKIIICSPIWMGQLLSPVRSFINKYSNNATKCYLALSCASSEESKNDKFGYNTVIKKFEELTGDKFVSAHAFSVLKVIPPSNAKNDDIIMKTTFNDENFKNVILNEFSDFIEIINAT